VGAITEVLSSRYPLWRRVNQRPPKLVDAGLGRDHIGDRASFALLQFDTLGPLSRV
jgi:hypothetical protein